MERIIAPYGMPGYAEVRGAHAMPQPAASRPTKTAKHYLRALRKRWWLLIGLWLLVVVPGVLFVVRQPAIYQATAVIEIVPPQFDGPLSVIVGHADAHPRDDTQQFVLNKIAQIKAKGLIDEVVHEFEPTDAAAAMALSVELFNGLSTKRNPGTNLFTVILDSRDPDRVEKMLDTLLQRFAENAKAKGSVTTENSKAKANQSIAALKKRQVGVNTEIEQLLRAIPHFAPGGRDRLEEDYLALKTITVQKQLRYEELAHEQRIAELYPNLHKATAEMDPAIRGQLSQLYQQKRAYDQQLGAIRQTLRPRAFNNDPYVKMIAEQLNEVCEDIKLLEEASSPHAVPNLAAMTMMRASDEIGKFKTELSQLEARMQASAPHFQKYLSLLQEQEHIEDMLRKQTDNLNKFEMMASTLREPVEIAEPPSALQTPVRPNRMLNIVLVVGLGMFVSLGVVFLLEAADRLLRDPEDVAFGLTLPLLAVVPRMRRLARTNRGGHLWTPGMPGSLEADAFRNLRASLIGIEAGERSLVTILVTSAKAGDGKSTTALNLAAACARAGERTILVDCDLRSSSLAKVFEDEPVVGLADVLRDEMPWQSAVVHCPQTPNLSFLPVGNVGGIPVEILGSIELKQLIASLSRHYHRVILDAPAILGVADGRFLGSLADATVFVVRAETHELSHLRRAKEMLEQTHARIAGIVFNDMSEDLQHWSSYEPLDNPICDGTGGRAELAIGLAPPTVAR